MAAVTVVRERRVVWGNKRAVLATVTTAASGDTYNTRLKLIDALSAEPLQGTAQQMSLLVTGGVVTFNHSGSGTSVTVIATGN